MNRSRFAILCCLFAFIPNAANACNIPVFRYALENWDPDHYTLVLLHEGDLNADQSQLLEQLTNKSLPQQSIANVNFLQVDRRKLAEAPPADLPAGMGAYLQRWIDHASPSGPTLVLLYPNQLPSSLPAWNGEFSLQNVTHVFDSPIRQEIANRILSGESAVWVFIESGKKEVDDEAFAQLTSLLEDVPDHVTLPDQDLIESDDEYNPSNKIDLKVEFSAVRVARDKVEELPFVAMLLGSEEDLLDFEEPIAIPVFARGRTYFALVGRGINADTVNENCQFLCGACSCQVKQDNPGIDLVMAYRVGFRKLSN